MSTLIHTISTKNQYINDSMWIYRNPKGLKILENELEERRKKRTSRNYLQYPTRDRESSINMDSPPAEFVLERNISPLTLSPALETYLPMEIEEEKQVNQLKPVPSKSVNKEPRKLLQLKPTQSEPRIKKLQETYNQNSFLTEAKQKLTSVQNKTGTTKAVPPRPAKANGVVSSFISVYEKTTSPVLTKTEPSSPPPVKLTHQVVTKPVSPPPSRTVSPVSTKIIPQSPAKEKEKETVTSPSYSLSSPKTMPSSPPKIVFESTRKPTLTSLSKTSGTSLLQAQRKKDIVIPKKEDPPIENELALITARLTKKQSPPKPPRHMTISPTIEKKCKDTEETKLISIIKQNLKEFDAPPPCIKQESKEQEPAEKESTNSDTDNDRNRRNIYSPQLSPEIGFCNVERDYNVIPSSISSPPSSLSFGNKKSIKRKVLKKKVSFHDEPSYIPETTTTKTTTTIPKKEKTDKIQNFVTSINTELTSVSEALVAAKKVNISPREKFVPVKQTRTSPSSSPTGTTTKTTITTTTTTTTPQRLSNKLLDVFQQKSSALSQNTVRLSKPSPSPLPFDSSSQPLVHLTKTRPKKPTSLKKSYQITMPTAAAQPDWRIRALPKKSIFA